MQWVAMAFTLIGTILNVKKKRVGFLSWLIANVMWVVIQYQAGVPAMAICQIVFCITCIWGWYSWKDGDNNYD